MTDWHFAKLWNIVILNICFKNSRNPLQKDETLIRIPPKVSSALRAIPQA